MRGRMVLQAFLLTVPLGAAAHSLTLEIRPTTDPRRTVSCAVQLNRWQFSVVEWVGMGNQSMPPLRWVATETETGVLLGALGALLAEDLPGVDVLTSRTPAPPFVSVTWMTDLTDGLASGLYIQTGLDLPKALDDVVRTLLVGGPCAELLS